MRYMVTKLWNISLCKSSGDLSQLVYCKFCRGQKSLKNSQMINQSIYKYATVDPENQLWWFLSLESYVLGRRTENYWKALRKVSIPTPALPHKKAARRNNGILKICSRGEWGCRTWARQLQDRCRGGQTLWLCHTGKLAEGPQHVSGIGEELLDLTAQPFTYTFVLHWYLQSVGYLISCYMCLARLSGCFTNDSLWLGSCDSSLMCWKICVAFTALETLP